MHEDQPVIAITMSIITKITRVLFISLRNHGSHQPNQSGFHFGAWSPDSLMRTSEDPRGTSFLIQRLSVAMQCLRLLITFKYWNGLALYDTVPSSPRNTSKHIVEFDVVHKIA